MKYPEVRNYRDGSFVDGDRAYIDVYNPSDGSVISRVPMSTREDVDAAVSSAERAFPGWSRTPIKERVQVFYKYKALLDQHIDELAALVSEENGKVTSEARAEVPNPDGLLQAGQFVRVQLSGATRSGVFRVPQRAVLEGPQGKFVYVVGKDNKAEMRPVETGEWSGGDIVVIKGLNAGEQIIVDGVLKLGPGAPVQVGAAASAAGAPPAPAPASGAKQGG